MNRTASTAAMRYFKAISDAQLQAAGVTPVPAGRPPLREELPVTKKETAAAAMRLRILEAVSVKRMNIAEIAEAIGEPVRAVQAHTRQMTKARPPQLRVVGTWAQQVAFTGGRLGKMRRDAAVFGPPGAPYLPELDDDTPGRRRRARGSGVISGGRYFCATPAPLRRDPFEHMKLALLTRG